MGTYAVQDKKVAGRRVALCAIGVWVLSWVPLAAQGPGIEFSKSCGLVVMGGSRYQYFTQNQSENSIYIQPLEGERRAIYTPDARYRDVNLSPSCRLVAYLESNGEVEGADLKIISIEGREELTIPSVQTYTWGGTEATGDLMAYTTGTDYEGGLGFLPKGTWLLDVRTRSRHQIHPGGFYAAWSVFDQSFYIWQLHFMNKEPNTEVQRYSIQRKVLEKTPYQGIYFSSDGRYLYDAGFDGARFRVFTREDNVELTGPSYSALLDVGGISPGGWISNSHIVFAGYAPNKRKCWIIDLATVQKWEVEEGEAFGFADKDEKLLLILIDGQIVTRKFEDVAKLIYPVPEGSEAAKTTVTEKKAE